MKGEKIAFHGSGYVGDTPTIGHILGKSEIEIWLSHIQRDIAAENVTSIITDYHKQGSGTGNISKKKSWLKHSKICP